MTRQARSEANALHHQAKAAADEAELSMGRARQEISRFFLGDGSPWEQAFEPEEVEEAEYRPRPTKL